MHLRSKKIESRYFSHAPPCKVFLQVLIVTTQAEENYPLSSQEMFFRKPVSPSRKYGEGNHDATIRPLEIICHFLVDH